MDIKWGNTAQNIATANQLINAAKNKEQADGSTPPDLYILPEMFTTGFDTNPDQLVNDSATVVVWMQEKSKETSAAICGSIATEENGLYFNRLFFVKPDSTVETYDKRHLFSYGGENIKYTHGTKRVVVEWLGWRFLLQICYDIRFPVFSRNRMICKNEVHNDKICNMESNTKIADYDVAIYVANWPESRMMMWDTLLLARAIENQCYVVGVNRVGDDQRCHYTGGSRIVDAYANIISECPNSIESTSTAFLDRERLDSFRNKFGVLDDADTSYF